MRISFDIIQALRAFWHAAALMLTGQTDQGIRLPAQSHSFITLARPKRRHPATALARHPLDAFSRFCSERAQRMTTVFLTVFLLSLGSAMAATPTGTLINNTARLDLTLGGPGINLSTNTVSVLVDGQQPTPATLRLLQLIYDSTNPPLPGTEYSLDGTGNGVFQPILPVPATGVPTVVPAFHTGEPIVVELTDFDQNGDPGNPDTVLVTILCPETGDRELLRLLESGDNTGIFIGYIHTNATSGHSIDGILTVTPSCNVAASYTDPVNGDQAEDQGLVDPYGYVFDSHTGEPVDGATVGLYDLATGALATTIFGDNGLPGFPAEIVTGSTFVHGGITYSFPPGNFRFPQIPPGNYVLRVSSLDGYSFPTAYTLQELQAMHGDSYQIVVPGSFNDAFPVAPGPVVHIDIPVDPDAGELFVKKAAMKSIVAIGDFLQYRLSVENSNTGQNAIDVILRDHLPLGFRYQSGSLRINDQNSREPSISADGRDLEIALGDVPPSTRLNISYIVEVAAGARLGKATNRVMATSASGESSNLATAVVQVRDDFMKSHSILTGRILSEGCTDRDTEQDGLQGVRIYLEDGTFTFTDERGMYHFEGIEPGVHVVQVDTTTLPQDYVMIACEPSNQYAGRDFSQFVDLQGGTLWQVNFNAAPKSQREGAASSNKPHHETVQTGSEEALSREIKPGIFFPEEQAHIAIDSVSVRAYLDSKLTPKLLVDGVEVPADKLGLSYVKEGTALTFYNYFGISLDDPGTHTLELHGLDPFGNSRFAKSIQVTRTSEINTIQFAEIITNVADGLTPIRIRLALRDKRGELIQAPADLHLENSLLRPLGASDNDQNYQEQSPRRDILHIDRNGIAAFEPVSQSGRYVATLKFKEIEEQIDIPVQGHMRDWILVGFAEGTMGYNNLSGNAVSLDEAGIDDHYYDDSRVKFFAKGAIKGEWLLTMAYDSDKPNLDGRELHQFIDPNAYYPLYGDVTLQGYEASSAREIYIKLEREQFYAMFGDMNTNLSQTELSRYTRTMNGFKSEMQTYRFSYTVFAAETRQSFAKDEIRGDGTSGRYYLSKKDVVINSEEVVIETRDRLRNEIIVSSEALNRYTDYDIDYETGSLYFKHPVPNRDDAFNPVFIVARYETYSSSGKNLNYGGRAAVRLFGQKVEVGGSYIHEEEGEGEGDLYGIDATVDLTPRTTLHVEAATTDKSLYEDDEQGDAYVAEVVHDTGRLRTSAYFREVDAEFGLGQLNNNESDMRKYGAEAQYAITPKVTVSGLAYHEDNLSSGAERDVATVDSIYNNKTYSLRAGLRHTRDELSDGTRQTSNQLLTGAGWTAPGGKLGLRAEYEQSLGSNNDNTDFPTLLRLGADYKLSSRVSLFADQEFTWGEEENLQSTRAGLRATPWDGGAIDTTLEQQIDENGQRLFALFGLGQTWRINQNWSMSAILERGQMVKSTEENTVNPNAAPAYGADDDFTSVSLGTTYRRKEMTWTGRIETRQADREDKYGATTSIVGEVDEGVALSAQANGFITDIDDGARRTDGDIRLGLAYRPQQSEWIILDRLDFYFDKFDGNDSDYRDQRLVNNLHANFKPNRKVQFSFYSGIKYVHDTIDGRTYSGVTDMHAAETRYNINKRWDLGAHGSVLHSWNSNNMGYSAGLSVGCMVVDNTWVSVGYNIEGFTDDDFDSAHYTAKGIYLRLRMKFDQQSVREAAAWLNR